MIRLFESVLLVIAIGLHLSSWNHSYAAPAKKHLTYQNLYQRASDIPNKPSYACLCHTQNVKIELTIHLGLGHRLDTVERDYTKSSFIEQPKIDLEHSISYEEPKNEDTALQNVIQNLPQWEQYNVKRQEATIDNISSENYKIRKKFVGYKALEEQMKPENILSTHKSRKNFHGKDQTFLQTPQITIEKLTKY